MIHQWSALFGSVLYQQQYPGGDFSSKVGLGTQGVCQGEDKSQFVLSVSTLVLPGRGLGEFPHPGHLCNLAQQYA